MKTFYWYDFETFGLSPKTSRIAQFAGIRTDENLNILDEKMFYCQPTNDCLPSPEACAVTGISPQLCAEKGIIEHKFISQINAEFSQPNTCIAGYNSIRFDDEFTRHTLYRNFFDPYAWHWQNGNTRWDILDVVRLCYALKKNSSLKWAYDEGGNPLFRLDKLSIANGIQHSNAHDALADVLATIEIAKIIKSTQPQLFDYAFSLRQKKTVAQKIKLFEPMLHTSGMYPPELSCTRLTAALGYHPEYSERAIIFNLDQDPKILLNSSIDELKTLMFTKQTELPEGVERLQIKDLVFNKSPMLVPNVHKIEAEIISQLQINLPQCLEYLDFIQNNKTAISKVVAEIYQNEPPPASTDADQALYDGFIDNSDKRICQQIQGLNVNDLKDFHPKFKDNKLSTLLLHFKARNYPNSLSEIESQQWFETVQARIQTGENGYLQLEDFLQSIKNMRSENPQQEKLWQQLEAYSTSLCQATSDL
ncbi:MAG: exodeoxyribonuclease I [Candidatus Thioglobus sp.]|nr:exodeoxyribonuclease I [Candidatus Thioglobus sp.]